MLKPAKSKYLDWIAKEVVTAIYCTSTGCPTVMARISVVVPTLWRFSPFADVCVDVADCELVKEVILINNNTQDQPALSHLIWSHPKIKILDFGRNIFVNPAWNVGVYHSQGDIICLWNDDLIFDLHLLELVDQHFDPSQGAWGLWSSWPDTSIHLNPHTEQGLWGWGQLMFVSRKHWLDIPPELLVYCGDLWIFDTQKIFSGQNIYFSGLLYYTPGGVGGTSSRTYVHTVWRERDLYLQALKDYRLNYTLGFGD